MPHNIQPLDTHFLRRCVDSRGVKQWWLAREMGVDRKTVSRWLSGRVKRIDSQNAVQLARLLDCELDDLVAGDGEVCATPDDQKRAAELLVREDLLRHLSPSDNWQLAESLIRSSMAPDLPLQRLGGLYNLLSMAVWRQGRYGQGRELARHALGIADRINDRAMAHKARFNLATIDSITGRLQEARTMLAQCLERPEHFADQRDHALALANFASTCFDLADYGHSRPNQRRALEIFERLDLPYNQAIAWLNIGIEDAERGNFQEALLACEHSLRCSDRAGYPRGRFTAQAHIAGLRALRGEHTAALVMMRDALEGLARFDVYSLAVHEVEARVLRLCGDLRDAQAAIERARSKMVGFPAQLASLELEAARVAQARGDTAGEAAARASANDLYRAAGIPKRVRNTPVVEYGCMFSARTG